MRECWVARQGGVPEEDGGLRRIGVFIDYWYAYTSARQLFADPGVPPPPWFGNVAPGALAAMLVKRPPSGERRSERTLGGLHVFVRHYDPELHHSQHERVRRWELEGAQVTVGPSREQGGGHWQSSVSIALASGVVSALARGVCDTAVVFAGDGSLWPMFGAAGEAVELATWVGRDGEVPTTLVSLPGVWCHRLGEASFRQLLDDRRPSQHSSPKAARAMRLAEKERAAGVPPTAMAAAMQAAGLTPAAEPAATEPAPADPSADQPSHPAETDENPGGVRRIANKIFGRGA
jgi:hypothetical protein